MCIWAMTPASAIAVTLSGSKMAMAMAMAVAPCLYESRAGYPAKDHRFTFRAANERH
jgi:hypothetical protein